MRAPLAHWTLAPEQRFGPEGDVGHIGLVRIEANGDVLAATGMPSHILDYAPDGTLRRSLGSQGTGPGQFQAIGSIGSVGDSVYGTDMNTSQVSLFTPDGRYVHAWRVQPPGAGAAYNMPEALFPDHTAIVPVYVRTTPTRSDYTILHSRWDGSDPDTIVHIVTRTTEWWLGTYQTSQPFAQDAKYGISPDGQFIAVVDVDADSVGSDSVRVTLRRLDKSLVYRRKVPFEHEPITPHIRDSVLANRVRVLHRVSAQQIRASLFVPEYMVPVSDVLVGSDGSVWLKAARKSAGFTWLVVNPDGFAQATVTVPPRTRILTLDRGIWGVERDEDGVPTVVRWHAQPSP